MNCCGVPRQRLRHILSKSHYGQQQRGLKRGEESENRGGKGSEEKVEGVGGRKGKRIEGRKGKCREERDQGREYRKGRKIRKERW